MKKSTRPTIRDVAAAAGVSLGTASRALNRTGRVKDTTIAVVTQAAERLGYEPDAIAQSMRGGSTRVIGMLVSNTANPFLAEVIQGAEKRLQKAGYAMLIANTDNDRRREKSLIELFRRRRVDGLILAPCESEDPEMIERLGRESFPVAAYDRDIVEQGVGLNVDHYQGALETTRYLLNMGHTRIALISSSASVRPGRERIRGFEAAYAERGLTPDPGLILTERSSVEFVYSESLSLLSRNEPPTAFICLGTRILAGVLQGLRHTGRKVPEDASVVSIGDTDLSRLFTPAITSLTWDLPMIGELVAELLLKQLTDGVPTDGKRIAISTRLIPRESCAPVRL